MEGRALAPAARYVNCCRRQGGPARLRLHHPAQAPDWRPLRPIDGAAAGDHRGALAPRRLGDEEYLLHKRADRLAATSEVVHVAGWSRGEMREEFGRAEILAHDPLL